MKILGFDFDGVFINIEAEKAILFGEVINKYWGINSEVSQKVWIKNLGTSRRYKFDCMYRKYHKKRLSNEQYKEIESEFSEILLKEYYPQAKLIPEAIETASYIQSIFDLTFLSSGISFNEIQFLSSSFQLDAYFDLIFGTNHQYKSKEDHFTEIEGKNQKKIGIFIGDGLEDMRIAKKFDYFAIGLPVNHNPQDLINAGADIICDYNKLLNAINKILSDK